VHQVVFYYTEVSNISQAMEELQQNTGANW